LLAAARSFIYIIIIWHRIFKSSRKIQLYPFPLLSWDYAAAIVVYVLPRFGVRETAGQSGGVDRPVDQWNRPLNIKAIGCVDRSRRAVIRVARSPYANSYRLAKSPAEKREHFAGFRMLLTALASQLKRRAAAAIVPALNFLNHIRIFA
jgi:hypothetical protein